MLKLAHRNGRLTIGAKGIIMAKHVRPWPNWIRRLTTDQKIVDSNSAGRAIQEPLKLYAFRGSSYLVSVGRFRFAAHFEAY